VSGSRVGGAEEEGGGGAAAVKEEEVEEGAAAVKVEVSPDDTTAVRKMTDCTMRIKCQ